MREKTVGSQRSIKGTEILLKQLCSLLFAGELAAGPAVGGTRKEDAKAAKAATYEYSNILESRISHSL